MRSCIGSFKYRGVFRRLHPSLILYRLFVWLTRDVSVSEQSPHRHFRSRSPGPHCSWRIHYCVWVGVHPDIYQEARGQRYPSGRSFFIHEWIQYVRGSHVITSAAWEFPPANFIMSSVTPILFMECWGVCFVDGKISKLEVYARQERQPWLTDLWSIWGGIERGPVVLHYLCVSKSAWYPERQRHSIFTFVFRRTQK